MCRGVKRLIGRLGLLRVLRCTRPIVYTDTQWAGSASSSSSGRLEHNGTQMEAREEREREAIAESFACLFAGSWTEFNVDDEVGIIGLDWIGWAISHWRPQQPCSGSQCNSRLGSLVWTCMK